MRLLAIIPISLALSLATKAQTTFFSTERQAALNAQLAAEVLRKTTPLNLASVENYTCSIGLRLSPWMPNAPMLWRFSLIKDSQGNTAREPISLLGGWIFISSQFILSAHTESEFAAILAHAMAHVMLPQMTGQQLADDPGAPPPPRWTNDMETALAAYERYSELEADRVAVRALRAAGFDPGALLSYIERTQSPPVPERIANLKQAIQNQPESGPYIVSTDLFQSMQEQVQHELSTSQNTPKLPSLLHPNN